MNAKLEIFYNTTVVTTSYNMYKQSILKTR